MHKFIELKINRDFGDLITAYFDFFKANIKKFTNIFLRYNGIFIIGLLIVSYLLVTGFMGIIESEGQSDFGSGGLPPDDQLMFLGVGGILAFLLFICIAFLNYSLAGVYMVKYERSQGSNFEDKSVWNDITDNFGKIFLFVLLLIPIYMVFMIISFIFALLPIIGLIPQYITQFFAGAWIGVSFFVLLNEDKGVMESYGEGWSLVTKNFWKSVGVNFILGFLLGLLILLVMAIPGVIVGLYTWHVVANDVVFTSSIVAKIIYTVCLTLVLLVFTYSQCLTQFINGLLYYGLHEKEYNTHTRNKIDQIGNLGE